MLSRGVVESVWFFHCITITITHTCLTSYLSPALDALSLRGFFSVILCFRLKTAIEIDFNCCGNGLNVEPLSVNLLLVFEFFYKILFIFLCV